jgi:xanthine dehydrogenase small subunit
MRRFAGKQIRSVGTIGGNIANGSPIGDTPPALIALGATLRLQMGKKQRTIPLEDFFIAYGKQDRAAGEFVRSVHVPKLRTNERFRCYKISKRFDQDITATLGAFNIKLANGIVEDVRIAFGGMAPTPKRALACEAALKGKPWTRATVAEGQLALRRDYAPITDMRASKEYRSLVAEKLLLKFFLETTEGAAATRVLERRQAHG